MVFFTNGSWQILTPSKLYLEYAYLQHRPFYRETWFMVTLAATSIIIIIMVIAVLCVKSKSYKYKRKLSVIYLYQAILNYEKLRITCILIY